MDNSGSCRVSKNFGLMKYFHLFIFYSFLCSFSSINLVSDSRNNTEFGKNMDIILKFPYMQILKITIMKQIAIQKQQHSLAKKQVSSEPTKEVSNLLNKKQYQLEDLMGLSWILFEEGKYYD